MSTPRPLPPIPNKSNVIPINIPTGIPVEPAESDENEVYAVVVDVYDAYPVDDDTHLLHFIYSI